MFKGERAVCLSQKLRIPVEAKVKAGETPVAMRGVVLGRIKPFSSKEANAPYRHEVVLGDVTQTVEGETIRMEGKWAVNVRDIQLIPPHT